MDPVHFTGPTILEKTFSRMSLCRGDRYSLGMQSLLLDPDSYLNSCDFFIKNKPNDTTTVGVVTIDDRLLVIKRYNIKGFWHGVNRGFRFSRAHRSWCNAGLLKALGISSVIPIAMVEKRFGPIRRSAYLVMDFVEGLSARRYFREGAIPNGEWPVVARQMVAVLQRLHLARISHGDLNDSNFLLTAGGPMLLDLDHMKLHRWWLGFIKASARDKRGFMKYWHDSPVAMTIFRQLVG